MKKRKSKSEKGSAVTRITAFSMSFGPPVKYIEAWKPLFGVVGCGPEEYGKFGFFNRPPDEHYNNVHYYAIAKACKGLSKHKKGYDFENMHFGHASYLVGKTYYCLVMLVWNTKARCDDEDHQTHLRYLITRHRTQENAKSAATKGKDILLKSLE